jgi:hypothetical protein
MGFFDIISYVYFDLYVIPLVFMDFCISDIQGTLFKMLVLKLHLVSLTCNSLSYLPCFVTGSNSIFP